MLKLFTSRKQEVIHSPQPVQNTNAMEELTDEMLTAVSGGKRCDGLSWTSCWAYTVFG